MTRIVRTLSLLAAILLGATPVVWAQTAGESAQRPFRGLFGAGDAAPVDRPSTTLVVSAFGGFNDDLQHARVEDPAGLAQADQRAIDPAVHAGLTYQRPGRRVQFGWTGDGLVRRYSALDGMVDGSGQVGASLTATVSRHAVVRFSQRVDYASRYLLATPRRSFDTLGGDARPSTTTDGSLGGNRFIGDPLLSVESGAGFSYAFGDRSSLAFDYGYHQATGINSRRSLDVFANRLGARFNHQVTRYASARFGYAMEQAEYRDDAGQRRLRTHDLDIGADYRRGISLTRRTRLNATAGSTFVGGRQRLQARVIGAVDAVHEFGRTWTARLGYDRGVHFMDQIGAPAFTDTVAASASGLIGRRLTIALSSDFTIGHVGLGGGSDPYESLTAGSRLQYAFSRRVALFAAYQLYQYRFATATQLPSLLPQRMRQSTAHVGIVWRGLILR